MAVSVLQMFPAASHDISKAVFLFKNKKELMQILLTTNIYRNLSGYFFPFQIFIYL